MDPVEEFPRRDRHRPGQPDQGVDPADPFAFLQQPYLGPVERGPLAQLFLGEVFAITDAAQVLAEALGQGDGLPALSHPRRRPEG